MWLNKYVKKPKKLYNTISALTGRLSRKLGTSAGADGEKEPQQEGEEDQTWWEWLLERWYRLQPYQRAGLRAFGVVSLFYFVTLIMFMPFAKEKWLPYDPDQSYSARMVDGFYFASVTVSTVGYGDILPADHDTMLVTCVLILVGLSFIMFEFNSFADVLIQQLQKEERLAVTSALKRLETMGSAEIEASPLRRLQLWLSEVISNITYNQQLLLRGSVMLFLNIAVGTFVLYAFEDNDFVEALYGAVTTVTTVGYGDVTFTKTSTRFFAIFYLLFSPIVTVNSFNNICQAVLDIEGKLIRAREALLKETTVKTEGAEQLDVDGDGLVSELEYVLSKLSEMKLLNAEAFKHVESIRQVFQQADVTGSGVVLLQDVLKIQQTPDRKAKRGSICLADENALSPSRNVVPEQEPGNGGTLATHAISPERSHHTPTKGEQVPTAV